MEKLLLSFLILFIFTTHSKSQVLPKRELRAAWIATFSNIDWPVKTQTPQQQKDAFIDIINHHQQTGINVVYVQVRSQCDALYPSSIEPWSSDLTGTQGTAPNPIWDPMQFMIEECHKRGIEFHAWINPYRAISNYSNINSFSPNHVARKNPEWLISAGSLRTLDPGLPLVRDYINSVILDIITRYDVDGIHFDDYFYPSSTFTDDQTFNTYPRGFTNRADWRRDNVSLLIKRLGETINATKPWVKFGISPSGIYRNSTNPAIGSPTSGLEHYTTLYADSRKWLQEGWIDYLAPQVYWYIGQSGADYSKVVPWWNNNAFGRHIYIGLAGYKVNDGTQAENWMVSTEIPNQVRLNRTYSNIYGQSVYNTKSMRSSATLGFRDSMRTKLYRKPALLPLMLWKDNTPPASPQVLQVSKSQSDAFTLSWNAPTQNQSNQFDIVKRYVIYRSSNPVVDISNPENILAIIPSTSTQYIDAGVNTSLPYYYSVTALDRFQNESQLSNTVFTLPVNIYSFTVKPENNAVKIEWETLSEQNNEFFDVEHSADGVNFTHLAKVNSNKNTSEKKKYSVYDRNPQAGMNYYRLWQQDKNGERQQLGTKAISLNALAEPGIVLFPNPVTDKINLKLEKHLGKQVEVKLLSLSGDIIHREFFTVSENKSLTLKKRLPGGHYLLQISGPDIDDVIKFMVL